MFYHLWFAYAEYLILRVTLLVLLALTLVSTVRKKYDPLPGSLVVVACVVLAILGLLGRLSDFSRRGPPVSLSSGLPLFVFVFS